MRSISSTVCFAALLSLFGALPAAADEQAAPAATDEIEYATFVEMPAEQAASADDAAPAEEAKSEAKPEAASAKETPATKAFLAKLAKSRAEVQAKNAQQAEPPATQGLGGSLKNGFYFLAALFVLGSLYKRRNAKNAGDAGEQPIAIKARRGLGGKTSLLIVEAEGQRFLLAQSGDDVSLVSPLAGAGAAAAAPTQQPASFAAELGELRYSQPVRVTAGGER